MTSAVSILPSQQLAALNAAYRKAVARKRLRFAVGAALLYAGFVYPMRFAAVFRPRVPVKSP